MGGHGVGVGLHERRGHLRRRGAGPRRAVAAAQVGQERELADAQQRGPRDVQQRRVEGASGGRHHPQAGRLVGEPAGVLGLVADGDPHQREQARPDGGDLLAVDRHGGPADALQHDPHPGGC